MCGIAGIIGKFDDSLIHSMTESLTHRGPDDSGYYIEKDNIALGHRRLSIIDIAGGKQPFVIGDYYLIYNGELYNYLELKSELEKLGHEFKTKSDTEVLLRCFIQFGPKCLEKFNGIFAFSIWNKQSEELFIARDRFGVCPLYFSQVNSKLYFASETKALLKVPEINKELNYEAIDEYLTFRYIRSNITSFNGIKKFPPAHYAIYKNGSLRFEKYWCVNSAKYQISSGDYVEAFKSLLLDSVKLRALASDVPVGAYLSSGIDSSSIVSLMSQFSKVKTFTIGFNSGIDELNESRKLSSSIGAEHNEIILNKSDWDLLPKIVNCLDEPVGDPIILPTYTLSSFASKGVKVVLTGDGADELMGGYIHQQSFHRLARLLRFIPASSVSNLTSLIKLFPVNFFNLFFPYPEKLANSGKERAMLFFKSIPNEMSMYLNFTSLFSEVERQGIYGDTLKNSLNGSSINYMNHIGNVLNSKMEPETLFNRVVNLDINTWLPNQILHKSDRLLLANSLEGRQPFLDYRLAELVFGLPHAYKVSFLQTKTILRKAMKEILPAGNINLKKKAFHLPLGSYFFNEYQNLVKQTLLVANPKLVSQGIISKQWLESFTKMNLDNTDLLTTKKLFALSALELWLGALK